MKMMVCYFALLLLCCSLTITLTQCFQVELIPIDSTPKTPSLSPQERLTNSLERCGSACYSSSKPSVGIRNVGMYVISAQIGTPSQQVLGVADTGSNLVWVKSINCRDPEQDKLCFPHFRKDEFNPASSTTLSYPSCNTDVDLWCNTDVYGTDSGFRLFCRGDQVCRYEQHYVDETLSEGSLVHDQFYFGDGEAGSDAVQNTSILFGVGDKNNMSSSINNVSDGIFGLGRGNLSLVSQLVSRYGDEYKQFSYCLTSNTENSAMRFGPTAVTSGTEHEFQTIQLLNDKSPHYKATLLEVDVEYTNKQGVRITGKAEEYNTAWNPLEIGNTVVDSGSGITYLESEFFSRVMRRVINAVTDSLTSPEPVESPEQWLPMCFDGYGIIDEFPSLNFYFQGVDGEKVRVQVPPSNVFFNYQTTEHGFFPRTRNYVCMAIGPTQAEFNVGQTSIFGARQQQNFQLLYNLRNITLAFRPTNCSEY